ARAAAGMLIALRKGTLPQPPPLPKSNPFSPDPHSKQDARVARWLGVVTIVSTLTYMFFSIAQPWYREHLMQESVMGAWKHGSSADSPGYVEHEAFSGGVRIPLLILLP